MPAPSPGLMFHHFHGGAHPAGQGSLSADELDALLLEIGLERFLPAREWRRRALDGRLAGELCLTFDDTLRCQFEIALPVLRRRRLTAFWFITTSVLTGRPLKLEIYRAFRTRYFPSPDDFYEAFFRYLATSDAADELRDGLATFDPSSYLAAFPFYSESDRRFRYTRDAILGPRRYERLMDEMILANGATLEELAAGLWMTAEHVRRLHDAGHVIGLHSHTHPTRMSELDLPSQRREYGENFAALRKLLNEPPLTMAHPCNSYNEDTLIVLRELGVELGFRANATMESHGPLERPRLDHTVALAELNRCASPA